MFPGSLAIWEKDMHHLAKDRAKVVRDGWFPKVELTYLGTRTSYLRRYMVFLWYRFAKHRKVPLGLLLPFHVPTYTSVSLTEMLKPPVSAGKAIPIYSLLFQFPLSFWLVVLMWSVLWKLSSITSNQMTGTTWGVSTWHQACNATGS